MFNKLTQKESRLCDTIRQHFENQGVLNEIKCELQQRIVKMMRGSGEAAHSKGHTANLDTRTLLLNQLIMEYFQWHEFNYSAEMFGMEAGIESCNINRETLETKLGRFQEKQIPILLEIVSKLLKEAQEKGDAK